MKKHIINKFSIVILFLFSLFSCSDGNTPDCIDLTPDDEYHCGDPVKTCDGKNLTASAQEWHLAVIDPTSKCYIEDTKKANTLQDAINCSKLTYPNYEIVDLDRMCEYWIIYYGTCSFVITYNLNSDYALQCVKWTTDIDGDFEDLTDYVRETSFCRGAANYSYADSIQDACTPTP